MLQKLQGPFPLMRGSARFFGFNLKGAASKMAKAKVRNRFTEEQQRVAVADLANMTIEEAAKRHGCSASSLWTWKKKFQTGTAKPRSRRTAAPIATTASLESDQRLADLEAHVAELEAEGGRLRRLILDGFIQSESNAKLRRIAEIVRDGGRNQVQEIMEVLLQPQAASVPARGDDPEATSENSIGHKKRAR
jgi:transposase-like protein